MKDYKVEMKPTYWDVTLATGCYSDYTEKHLYFTGNDENEVWNFLCRYAEDKIKEKDKLFFDWEGKHYPIKWNDQKFIPKDYKENIEDIDWISGYDIFDTEIKRLNVIYFLK